MRVLVASDDRSIGQRVLAALRQEGINCPDGHYVRLDAAADRAGVLHPDLGVFVLSSNKATGLDRLRETRNTVPHMHTLVLGPVTDPKLILETLKQGADEYLDEKTPESELSESLVRYRATATLTQDQKQSGRVITVVGASGGSGCSMIAVNLSAVLAQQCGECGLLDLRLGIGDLGPMLDVRPSRTLADLCDCLSRLDQKLFDQFLASHSNGVRLLASPIQCSDSGRVTAKGVRRALALARIRFSNAVVDMGGVLSDVHCETLWQADTILLVLRADYTSVRNTRRIIENMAEMGIGRDRMRLVVNGHRQSGQLDIEQAEAAVGLKVTHQVPYDPKAVNLAVNEGVPVVLARRFSKVSRSIRALATRLGEQAPVAPRIGPRLVSETLAGARHQPAIPQEVGS